MLGEYVTTQVMTESNPRKDFTMQQRREFISEQNNYGSVLDLGRK